MRIIITETQLNKIISEGNEDVIKKKIETLYKAFRKGSVKVNTTDSGYFMGSRPEFKDMDIIIDYELPETYKILINDKSRKKESGYWYDPQDHSVIVPEVKLSSKEITDKNMFSTLRKEVMNILKSRFEKITNADLILKPTAFRMVKDKWVSID